jgi:transcriptional regulator GlxA family with amidase domain
MQVAILLYEGVTALDAVGPYEVLSRLPGARIRFVAIEPGPVRTDTRMLTLVADEELSRVPHPDLLLIPGGVAGTFAAMKRAAHLEWIRTAHETTRWTTSVCSGALILGAAGLLHDRRASTHWLVADRLSSYGATYTPERIVEDGKIITAAGVSAGIDMGLYLIGRIAGREMAEAIQLLIEYDPEPPFDTGSVSKASDAVRRQAELLLKREYLWGMGHRMIDRLGRPFSKDG